MKNLIGFLAIGLVLFSASILTAQDGSEDPTKWTSSGGKTIEAEFVRLVEDGVVLRLLTTGDEATVPFANLNLESHLKAIKLAKPEEFSKPLVKAEIAKVIEPPVMPPIDVERALKSPFNQNQTLEQFVNTLTTEFDNGNLFVVWHALPEKMQDDVGSILVSLVEKVGTARVVQVRALMTNLHKIFTDQKDFVFANPMVMEDKSSRKELYANWLVIEQSVGSFADEDLWQKENFTEENIERWLAHFLSVVGANMKAGQQMAPSQGVPNMGLSSVLRFVSGQDDKGKISFGIPFLMPEQELVARKVKGIWVVPTWMNQLRDGLDEGLVQVENIDEAAIQTPAQLALGTVITPISALANAQSQEAFDTAVESIRPLIESAQQQMEGQMAGMMGGAMGPGMGGPGFGGGPGQGGGRGAGQGFAGNQGGGNRRGGGLGAGPGGGGPAGGSGNRRGGGLGAGPGGGGAGTGNRRGGGLGAGPGT